MTSTKALYHCNVLKSQTIFSEITLDLEHWKTYEFVKKNYILHYFWTLSSLLHNSPFKMVIS